MAGSKGWSHREKYFPPPVFQGVDNLDNKEYKSGFLSRADFKEPGFFSCHSAEGCRRTSGFLALIPGFSVSFTHILFFNNTCLCTVYFTTSDNWNYILPIRLVTTLSITIEEGRDCWSIDSFHPLSCHIRPESYEGLSWTKIKINLRPLNVVICLEK